MFIEKTKKILLYLSASFLLLFSFSVFSSNEADAISLTTSSSPTVCGLNDIGWLVCPILRSAAKGSDYAFAFISTSLLQFESSILSSGKSGSGEIAKNAWNMTVSVANIVLVIGFLFIIYSYVSGRSVSGGYALKKMIPRLLIVAILINVSYVLCLALIDISNIAGYSILSLTNSLLESSGASPGLALHVKSDISASPGAGDPSDDFSILTKITSNILSNPSLAWVLSVPLAVIILSILLICAIMIVVLIFRKILIVTMVLLAPIAFALYLLPNTEKLFTQWKKLTLSALLLYPIIALLLASGQIVSSAINANGSDISDGGYVIHGDKNNGKSQTTALISAAAAVLPLLGTWYVFKLSMAGIDMASVRVKKGYSRKSGNKSAERRREITAKLGGSNNIMSNIQKVQQAIRGSDSSSGAFGGSRRGRKKDNQSQDQTDFDNAVNARLQEIKSEKNGPAPQIRYAKALKKFQDENKDASTTSSRSGAMNINNASAVELKAAEAYLLDSMSSGSLNTSNSFRPRANMNNSLEKFTPSNNQSPLFNKGQGNSQQQNDSQSQTSSLGENKLSLGGILSPNSGASNGSNSSGSGSMASQDSSNITQTGNVNVESAIINMNGSDSKNGNGLKVNNTNGTVPTGNSGKKGVLENGVDNRNINPTSELEKKAKARAAKYVNAAHQTENDDLFNGDNSQNDNSGNSGKVFDIKQNNKKG